MGDGPLVNLLGLSVDTIDAIERLTGKTWAELTQNGTVREWREALVLAGNGNPGAARVGDLIGFLNSGFEDDLPDVFVDGIPDHGSRTADRYIVYFGGPPWCWPPDVVRRQSVRDLQLLAAAQGGNDG